MLDLDINAFYFHSLILGKDDTLKVFEKILKDGKILSLSQGAYNNHRLRMNTSDEICLSRVTGLNITGSAYDLFAMKKLSFIIKGNIPGVYSPKLIPERESMSYIESGLTDLEGEFRIKDEISLKYVVDLICQLVLFWMECLDINIFSLVVMNLEK